MTIRCHSLNRVEEAAEALLRLAEYQRRKEERQALEAAEQEMDRDEHQPLAEAA